MVAMLMAFCAVGGILLFALGVYAEFLELRAHPEHLDQRVPLGGAGLGKHGSK